MKSPAPPRPSTYSLIRRTVAYARPYLWVLALACLFALAFSGARFGRAYLAKPLMDEVLMGEADLAERWAQFQTLALIALGIILYTPFALFGRSWLMKYALGRMATDVRNQLAAKLLRLPLSHHRRTSTGDTITRAIYDAEHSQLVNQYIFSDFVQAGLMVIVGVGTMFAVSWPLALLSVSITPAIIGVIAFFAGRVRRSADRRQLQMGEVTQRLTGILSGIKVIKAFRGEDLENRAFGNEAFRLFKRQMKLIRYAVMSRALVEMMNNGVGLIVLVVGAGMAVQGVWGLTVGDVTAFALVSSAIYRPVKTLSRGWTQLMEATASSARLFEVLDTEEEPADAPDAVRVDDVRESITFDGVSFSYEHEPVLRDISLKVSRGEVIAIVGPTGAGKTTLVDLLLRFYEPDSGSIRIDDVDLRRIQRNSLLDLTAVVTQEPFLFDTTIRENIAYGRMDAPPELFERAVRAAHVDEFVDQLPDGYETQVGEFGLLLSGGQRQRITIARAILRDPAILVFDEATSALDAKTERIVQDALDSLRGHRTVFIVAHRLSTIRHADRIVVLEGGRVSQIGTHEELVEEGGLYREFVALQTDEEARR